MSYFKDNNKKDYFLQKGRDSLDISKKSLNNSNKKPTDLSVYQTIIDIIGINSYTWKIYIICSLFFLSDGAEMIVLSLVLSRISDSWDISASSKGMLGSSVFVGIFIGALICGRHSDIKGRKPVFVIGSLLVTIFSFLSAFSNGYFTFFLCRVLCGVGVGLSLPSSMALSTEVTPTFYRHFVIVILLFSFPVGEIFVIILAKFVLPLEWGWRYLLAFATIPCFIGYLLSLIISESPKFLLTTRRFEEAFQSLEKLISASNKQFILTDKIKEKLKEEFICYTNLIQNDSEEIEEEKKESFFESLKKAFNFTRQLPNEEEYSEENLRKKLEDFVNNDQKQKRKNTNDNNNSNNNRDSLDSLQLKYKQNFIQRDSFDFNMFENIYSTRSKKKNSEADEIKKMFSMEKEKTFNSGMIDDNVIPSFNYKELFTKKYKFLSIMIWILFTMCSVVFYGMIYILPQILERHELRELELNELNKIVNNTNITNISNINKVSHYSNFTNLNNSSILNNSISNHNNNSITNTTITDHVKFKDMSYNSFIQLLISALMQIPSTVFAGYLASFGRIKSMALGFFFSFLFCLIALLSKSWFYIAIAFSKFFIGIPDLISMLYVCEAYPTKIRALGVGVANSWYRAGGVLTPIVNQILFEMHYLAPYVLFTIGSLVGFLATISLPFESVGKNIR